MTQDRLEWDVVIESADITQLHEKEERGGRILKASHNGMRRELDERSKPHQTKQCLEHTSEKYDGEKREDKNVYVAATQDLGIGMR